MDIGVIEQEALKLDVKARGRLIARLLTSLRSGESGTDELEHKRAGEAHRRNLDPISGDSDGEVVFRRLKDRRE
jgi:hypothetical protein